MSLRNRFSLRKKEFRVVVRMGDWGWEKEGGCVTMVKQIRKPMKVLES